MSGKIVEYNKIDVEVLAISSAAGSTSQAYDLREFPQAAVLVSVEGSYAPGVTIDLMESSAATAAGSSAAGSKAGLVIGGTAATYIADGGVRKMTLTCSSATADEYFTLTAGTVTKKFTYTTSTAAFPIASTMQTATNLYFGSTVGSTVNTGIALSIDALKAAIESTLGFGGAVICSTPATDAITVEAADSAAGALGLTATAVMTALVNQAAGCFNIRADALSTGKRYIAAKVSTASSACRAAVCVIREGGRYMPPANVKYRLSS